MRVCLCVFMCVCVCARAGYSFAPLFHKKSGPENQSTSIGRMQVCVCMWSGGGSATYTDHTVLFHSAVDRTTGLEPPQKSGYGLWKDWRAWENVWILP